MDAGVRRRREKREPEGRRGPTAHLSVHLDGLLLQGSAPSPPERLLVRPPGRPARPQPQFERVAPHHEEATVLGPRRAAPGQRLGPDLTDSPRGQQRDQDEEEGESRLPPAAPCRHVRANATAGGAATRRECAARGRDAGRAGAARAAPGAPGRPHRLKCKMQTIKLPEENIRENLSDLGYGNDFLDYNTNSWKK